MVLQYSFVILIYYFLFKVIKVAYSDLKTDKYTIHFVNESESENAEQHVQAKLIVVDSGNVKLDDTLFFLGETASIGRSIDSDIVIDDVFVSHDHACITKYKHDYWLTDLKSTNKTYVNGQRITDEVSLKNGDSITIGAVTFRFER